MQTENIDLIKIQCDSAEKFNFSCQQAAYSLIKNLQIKNVSKEAQENIIVTLSADPPFLTPKSWRFERIMPGEILSVQDRDIELDVKFLQDNSEAVLGNLSIVAEQENGKKGTIARISLPVTLLAHNEWSGADYMPELLAVFSMPNDPVIDHILRNASGMLAKKGLIMDGYQSGSRERVWQTANAIYAAIGQHNIRYAAPPASFEKSGQKIRSPSTIWEKGVATCLDSTMLFCSVLEQAGLNPIVVLPKEHALVGVWLQESEGLANIMIDDAETLRKAESLHDLILIETTLALSSAPPLFSDALKDGKNKIAPEHDGTFDSAVDIKRARADRILPLGKKMQEEKSIAKQAQEENVPAVPLENAPSLPPSDTVKEEEKPKTPDGRLDRWLRKLLDLTARNPLLNHKSVKTSLPVICPDPHALENMLAEGKKVALLSQEKYSASGQDVEIYKSRTGKHKKQEDARIALDKKQLLVSLPEDETEKRVITMDRKAKTSLQEGGANTLYLALGFLLWKRTKGGDRQFRAPLILYPITMERKTARSVVKIMAGDDEPRFNTTLLEMLKRDYRIDIQGLDGDLPRDKSGIDVNEIWRKVREEIKDSVGFEVVEEVALGHFSFAKYLMWKNLRDRTEVLKRSPLVKHLMETPSEKFPSDISFVLPSEIESQYRPSDLLLPMSADSSQMTAIAAADRGKTFVIIGPPGTGKSQTISNLIAHLLGKGKAVLFVSEKIAALNVVARRLHEIGVGLHCLELHSNKANKADVLEKLKNVNESVALLNGDQWEEKAEQLRQVRDRLSVFVKRLHKIRSNGLTVYYALGIVVRDRCLGDSINFSWDSADVHNQEQFKQLEEQVLKLEVYARPIQNFEHHPLRIIRHHSWSPAWENEIEYEADRAIGALGQLERAFSHLSSMIKKLPPSLTLDSMARQAKLATLLQDPRCQKVAFALSENGGDKMGLLEKAIQHLEAYQKAKNQLSCPYAEKAWQQIDGEAIVAQWRHFGKSHGIIRFLMHWWIVISMKRAGALGMPKPENDALCLSVMRSEGWRIDRLDSELKFLRAWEAHDSDLAELKQIHKLANDIRRATGKLADEAGVLAVLRKEVQYLLEEHQDFFAPGKKIGRALEIFSKCYERAQAVLSCFAKVAGYMDGLCFQEGMNIDDIRVALKAVSENKKALRDWCAWQDARAQALKMELNSLVDAIEQNAINKDNIKGVFMAAYCRWWSMAVISKDEVLRSFTSHGHESEIEKFRNMDVGFEKATADYIVAKLGERVHSAKKTHLIRKWSTLEREIRKRTRRKAVRQLVREIPDVLTALTPCFMMSPLSIAQYLPLEQDLFDVVIFDEASQITTWDAIGALAHAKQAIVVGDPKQMPPTNFFNRSDTDDHLGDDVELEPDLESILDEVAASVPTKMLNLHYRSRKEGLIQFSNSRYYDDKLITFPAPSVPGTDNAVRLIDTEGVYSRGKARNNRIEAEKVVAEIISRIKSSSPHAWKSIGVVTLNSQQQTLILDLLEIERRKDANIEWAFAEDITEPVFVKNLETVQGDERDVIFFSITYGPDENGHVYMSFGPLNREGGERRLNVAMTRAREEMLVFSSLAPEHIDVRKTRARAVEHLREFLFYAKTGVLPTSITLGGGDFESPFEEAVAKALKEKGWELHCQVGVSAYRIDLGIVHPDKKGLFLAGVECDGATYHSSAVARERDRIRQTVLNDLGWKLVRVWSTDWWHDADKALEEIDAKLREFLSEDRRRDEQTGKKISEQE